MLTIFYTRIVPMSTQTPFEICHTDAATETHRAFRASVTMSAPSIVLSAYFSVYLKRAFSFVVFFALSMIMARP